MCSNGSTYAERYAERMARYEERMARQEERRLAAVDECTRRSMAYCNNAMKKYATYNYELPAQNWELKAEYQCTIPKWKQKKMDKAAAKAAAAATAERPASPASSMTSSSEESLATTTRSKRSFSDKFRGFFRKDKKRSDSREFHDGPEPVWDEPEPYELPPKGYANDQDQEEEDQRPQVIRRDTAMRAELEPESDSESEAEQQPPVNIARPLPPQPTGGPSSSMHVEHDDDAHPERPPPSYMEATSTGAYTQH